MHGRVSERERKKKEYQKAPPVSCSQHRLRVRMRCAQGTAHTILFPFEQTARVGEEEEKIPLADNHNNNSTVSQIHDSLSFPYEDENTYFSLAPCINAETAAGGWWQGWLQGFWQVSPCVTTDIIISRPESKVAICRRLKCTWSLQHT